MESVDIISNIIDFCDHETKKKLCVLNKECFRFLHKKCFNAAALISLKNTITEDQCIYAFREQCYICGGKYRGAFNSVFDVYAHGRCIKTRCKYIYKYSPGLDMAKLPPNMKNIDNGTYNIFWKSKLDKDPIDIKDTLDYWLSPTQKRKLHIADDDELFITKARFSNTRDKDMYGKLKEALRDRITYFKAFCINSRRMTNLQFKTFLRLLISCREAKTGDYFFFRLRCSKEFKPITLLHKNIKLFDMVMQNDYDSDYAKSLSFHPDHRYKRAQYFFRVYDKYFEVFANDNRSDLIK